MAKNPVNKFTYEQVKYFVEIKSNSECKLTSEEYIDCYTNMKFKCKCGNYFETSFSDFKHANKRQCNDCGLKNTVKNKTKITHDMVRQFVESFGFKMHSQYKNNRTHLELECPKEHNFKRIYSHFKTNPTCPVCSGRKVDISNCLATLNPKLASEWNHDLNKNLTPYDITTGSNKKVWWTCKENSKHVWEVSPKDRKRFGCPYCDGKMVDEDNSFKKKYPELAKEWHPTKNGELNPSQFTYGSSKKEIWWLCEKGHEWKMAIVTRTNMGCNCPYCAGKYPTEENNLAVAYPEILRQWNYDKNKKLPNEYTPYSSHKVWWKCELCKHEWRSSINTRTSNSDGIFIGCSKCDQSEGEKRIAKYLDENSVSYRMQKKFEGCKNINCLPFDFYIKHLNLCIEYDGRQHFEVIDHWGGIDGLKYRQNNDKIKNTYCTNNNIKLLRIPYWENKNIENIISNTLKELQSI